MAILLVYHRGPMVIVNLGSGSRTSPYCINVDWSPYLRLKSNRLGSRIAPLVLRGNRRERFLDLDDTILIHDLRRPLPLPDDVADAVYHSHVLEHFDRRFVAPFLAEIRRVLKPGGIHRVVVPDFEASCRRYLAHLDSCAAPTTQDEAAENEHDEYVGEVIEQMVRRESTGTSQQRGVRRVIENLVFGDARRRGETHQWMYDRVNLAHALRRAGFHDISLVDYKTSSIAGWDEIRLDEREGGDEYIVGSLYMEAVK